jgi:biotin-dependent carboxylase-like uncharacterized protein
VTAGDDAHFDAYFDAQFDGQFEVVDGGPFTTIQDRGRPGLAHLGIPASGFLDPQAARLANRLVGNLEDDAVLETTGRGPVLRLMQSHPGTAGVTVAVTGAPAPVRIDAHLVDPESPLFVRVGQLLNLGPALAGVRSYLAVRGGLSMTPVLGSRSTDQLSGLGPPALRAGQRLPFGKASRPIPGTDVAAPTEIVHAPQLGIYPGPSQRRFGDDALTTLASNEWTVSPTSSRVGLRLQGPRLRRRDDRELPPEGMVTGALQVPPDGQPVLLLADHPTTGGYPVIAVVREQDLGFAAQAAPGTAVRFRILPFPG